MTVAVTKKKKRQWKVELVQGKTIIKRRKEILRGEKLQLI
jgi:hypothetical protein